LPVLFFGNSPTQNTLIPKMIFRDIKIPARVDRFRHLCQLDVLASRV
jgi:hypothetical protein